MKIAQIALTKTESGCWKIVVMSRKQIESVLVDGNVENAVRDIQDRMQAYEWEQLTHD
jgi:hypothetical protein